MYIREMDIEADNGAVGRCRRDTLLYYESEEGKCLKFGLHESLLESVATLLPFYNEFNCLISIAGNTRGRFQSGRGAGFRNDGGRGRGNYGGGRGYGRDDFNGRNEFNNRGGSRGGLSNRGGEGYRRTDNTGGRMNRGGGVPNGTAKAAPRYSATA